MVPSLTIDDLEADGHGMPATWINDSAALHGVIERIPATVLSVTRHGGYGERLEITSREERNGSQRTFVIDLDEVDKSGGMPRCGAFSLFIGARPTVEDGQPGAQHGSNR